MSTTRKEMVNTVAETPTTTTAATTTITTPTPSCELGNMNMNKNTNCNNKSNNNAEQPQTKRQKIEKQFKTKNLSATTTATSTTNSNNNNAVACSTQPPILNPAPNIAGVHSNNESNENINNNNNINMTLEPNNKEIVNSGSSSSSSSSNVNNNNNITVSTQNNRHLCSSLSSSVHSISPASSSNNSPNSTPSSSRATSFTQLINEQNLANSSSVVSRVVPLPHHQQPASLDSGKHQFYDAISDEVNAATEDTNSSNNNSSTILTKRQKQNSLCVDEVDRIAYDKATTTINDDFPAHFSSLPSEFYSVQNNCTKRPQSNANVNAMPIHSAAVLSTAFQDMNDFEEFLKRQCLCGVSENALRRPFESHYYIDQNGEQRIANLSEWATSKLIQFLSNLQLLFEIYLKQNSKGFICGRIMDVCEALISNDHNLIDEIIKLASYNNSYVQFLSGRVLTSFLVIAKHKMDENWLKKLVDNLFSLERSSSDRIKVKKIHFSLDIIKRIVEWRDVDQHPLEDEIKENAAFTYAGSSNSQTASSTSAPLTATSSSGPNGPNNGSSQLYALPISDSSASQNSLHNGVALLENQAFLHFPVRQLPLDENYFAVHFGAFSESSSDPYQSLMTSAPRSSNTSSNTSQARSNVFENHQEQEHQYQSQHSTNSHLIYPNSAYFIGSNSTTTSAAATPATTRHATDNCLPTSSSSLLGTTQGSSPATSPLNCQIVTLTDSESFDTKNLKGITIKILENKWQELVNNMSVLITNGLNVEDAESSVLAFLQLWENIITIKANLSVVETLPFYAQLDKFETLLGRDLPCTVYKQMLCLFNEALCYGSTLALQDMLPRETCSLAHQIVRHVKDFRMLETLPRRRSENVVGLIGYKGTPISYKNNAMESTHDVGGPMSPASLIHNDSVMAANENVIVAMDKTILQKVVLLVLKSIAVSVKEIRSDSSDSSIDSTDSDALQDMRLIEQSMRDVLRKLEVFIKQTLEFHPQCHFSKILIRLFDDQDDHLIEAMVCTLDVTSGLSYRNNAFPELVSLLNPVYTFLEFLKMISNSSDLLLDLLVSNETCFLLYLLRFLKYVRSNWLMFVRSCRDFGMGANTLEETMGVLNRLRKQISRLVSRQLFPYDISPVLRLLEHCDSLYEGNELA